MTRGGDSRLEWITCDTSEAQVIHSLPAESESRILRVSATVDRAGCCHVVWVVAGSEGEALWHAAWRESSPIERKSAAISKLDNGDLAYSVRAGANGIALALNNRSTGLLAVTEWDSEQFAWTNRWSGPATIEPPSGEPFFLRGASAMFWCSYFATPLDAAQARTSKPNREGRPTPSFDVFSSGHRSQPTLFTANMNGEVGRAWSPPVDVLHGVNAKQAHCGDQVVFEDKTSAVSIFTEVVPSPGEGDFPVLSHYSRNLQSDTRFSLHGSWPLFSDFSQWRVYPVSGSGIYYVFWQGPVDPTDGGSTLFWSRSDTPWASNVLVPKRAMKCRPPTGVFRSAPDGTCIGVVAWRAGPSRISVCRLSHGAWSPPSDLLIPGTSPIAVSLRSMSDGVFFTVDNTQLHAIPFRIEWK